MIWKQVLALLIPAAALSACGGSASPAPAADSQDAGGGKLWVYLGTYTQGTSKGIYLYHLDLSTGALVSAGLAAETTSPSFLAIHPGRRFLYAVGEIGDFRGKKAGAVSAFSIDPASGKLGLLNQQPSGGPGPCHVAVDRAGRNVLAANYGGGSVVCLPIGDDGRLGQAASFVQHEGHSVNPARQKGPHAHSVNLSPDGRFAFVADLGLDKIMIYGLDAASGKLAPGNPPSAGVAPGAGPRHFAFHPGGRFAYGINELNSTVTAFAYDAQRGTLGTVQTISTLPEGFSGTNYPAEVQVHPSGKYVYGSNRGHDSLAIFAVDAETGKLAPVGHQSTQGRNPRNFGIDPTGSYLLAANQDSDNVVVFRIDSRTGRLRPTGHEASISKPVCVKFLRPGR
jgi:6-phosphogluconolactonase